MRSGYPNSGDLAGRRVAEGDPLVHRVRDPTVAERRRAMSNENACPPPLLPAR
jgi:hypothetical protein